MKVSSARRMEQPAQPTVNSMRRMMSRCRQMAELFPFRIQGNNRIQQFSTNGTFAAAFGTNGTDIGQFNAPKGLTYDSVGTLYIVDSGNNRITLADGVFAEGVTGTNGSALGQLSDPVNISADERGVYIADTGNSRIQSFNPRPPHGSFTADSSSLRFAVSTNLNNPAAVAAVDNLTNEMFYVAGHRQQPCAAL